MSYTDFIPQNVAPLGTRRIGIYDSNGNRAGQIALGPLAPPNPYKKLYSFLLIADLHIGDSTSIDDYTRCILWANENVNFACECGDLIHGGADASEYQIGKYKECRAKAIIPIYAVSGNHDGAHVPNIETAIESYTGRPLYYSVEHGDDVFVFVGIKSTINGSLFADGELDWLEDTLEANKGRRVFLFEHVRPDDACGNALGIYDYDIWGGTEQTKFESLLRKYPNIIFFHGHSHLKFSLQTRDKSANIDRHFGCWSVHVPSITVPRGTVSAVDPTRVELYAESEGYVVDVYANGIHLRGRDFVKGEFLPIASYWMDTTLQNVQAGTYTDSTGTIKT